MKKTIIFLTTLLILNTLKAQSNLKTLVKQRENAVFKIMTFDKNKKPIATGSGFFISSNGIGVSNVHVFKNAYYAKVKLIDNTEIEIQNIIDFNEDFDLIKFSIKNSTNKSFTFLKPYNGKIEKGEEVFTIGCPLGLENTISTGIVSSVREIESYGRVIQITAPISHGSSGGTVFNSNGELIGVTTFGITEGQNLNFAVDIKKLSTLTKNINASIFEYTNEFSSDLFMLKGIAAMADKQYSKAVILFTQYINQKPNDDLGYLRRGNAYKELNEKDKAINDYEKTVLINPSNYTAYSNLGLLKAIIGNYKDGISDCVSSLKIKETANGFYNLGWICFEIKDFKQAEICYSKAISIDPTKATIYSERADARMQLSKYSEAINDFSILISLEPKNSYAYATRGLCYLKLSDKNNACKDFNVAKNMGFSDESFLKIYKDECN